MSADVQLLKSRLVEWIVRTQASDEVGQYVSSQGPDGTWPDLPYGDFDNHSWHVSMHLTRLLAMACAYRKEGSDLSGNRAVRDGIVAGLDTWLEKGFYSSGWWFNFIRVPRLVGRLMLLMEDELPKQTFAESITLLKRPWPGTWGARTGENLVWYAGVTVLRACLVENVALLNEALRAVGSTLVPTVQEGIQPDYSFHQHGPQLYSGGYGWDFMHDCALLLWAARDTSLAFPEPEVEVYSRYVMDGLQWMMRGQTLEYAVQGRELVRRNVGSKYERLMDACRMVIEMNTPRRAEFEDFLERLKRDDVEGGPVGSRMFWRSDFMVHRRRAYHVSIKMNSVWTFNTEELRGENRQNAHQADGVMAVLRSGREYQDILPVWDWRRLPGITCQQGDGLVPPVPVNTDAWVKTRFVGGLSDGTYGLAVFDFARDGLVARKSWFCFDREIVCLGAGITCSSERDVLTSLNQCLLKGPVSVGRGQERDELQTGTHDLDDVRWVHHDGVGYALPQPGRTTVANRTQKGAWNLVSAQASDEPVSMDVFSMWLDHGPGPKGADYAYVVLPGIDVEATARYADANEVDILSNTSQVQAVGHSALKLTQVAFHKPGCLASEGLPTLAADEPCLVMMRRNAGALVLSAAYPEREPVTLHVEVGLKLAGEGCEWLADRKVTRVTFQMPGGLKGGETISRKLTVTG